jgi:hypothetical protein
MKPSDVNISSQKIAIKNLYGFLWEKDNIPNQHINKKSKLKIGAYIKKSKFKIGDNVRLTKFKNIFKKGYEGYWTTEIFKISKIFFRKPKTVYEISNYNGDEIIEGTFYEDEIQKVNVSANMFWKIEKILKKEIRKNKMWFYVKFMNYEKPQWIPASNISDVSKVKNELK